MDFFIRALGVLFAAAIIFVAGVLYGDCTRGKTSAHESAEKMIKEAESDRAEALERALEACPEGNYIACKNAVAKYKQSREQDKDAVCLLVKDYTGASKMDFDCSPKKKFLSSIKPPGRPRKKTTKSKKPPAPDAGPMGPPAPPDSGPPPTG